jgi:hypothetical protein
MRRFVVLPQGAHSTDQWARLRRSALSDQSSACRGQSREDYGGLVTGGVHVNETAS